MTTYQEKLKDPRWQKKRLKILERDHWSCRRCGDTKSTLHIHYRLYENENPWEIEDDMLLALCDRCYKLVELRSRYRAGWYGQMFGS